jgi:hypothetical protein
VRNRRKVEIPGRRTCEGPPLELTLATSVGAGRPGLEDVGAEITADLLQFVVEKGKRRLLFVESKAKSPNPPEP